MTFNCRYIMFNIILYLFAWIEIYRVGVRVHKAMYKENSWILSKSTKDIKIINNIILSYYYGIFGSTFKYEIVQRKRRLYSGPQFLPSFRRHKRGILCRRISCNWSGNQNSIRSVCVKYFP